MGYTIKTDMPGLVGPEVEALYRRGANWLAGGSATARHEPMPSPLHSSDTSRHNPPHIMMGAG
jgi:hypothetical protein